MVLMHADRDMRIGFHCCFHHLAQKCFAGIFTRAGRGLQNHWAVAGIRCLHDGQNLLQVVDVESRQAIAVFGSVVQQLA